MVRRLFGSVAGGPTPCRAHRCGARPGPEWQVPAAGVVRHAAAAGVSVPARWGRPRGRGRQAWSPAATSALSHPLVGGAPRHRRRAVAAEAREFGRGFCAQAACGFAGTTPSCCATPAVPADLAGDGSGDRSQAGARAVGCPAPANWCGVRASDVMTVASAHSGRAGSAESGRRRHGRRQRHPDSGLFTRVRAAHSVGSGRLRRRRGVLPLRQWTGLCLRAPAHPSAFSLADFYLGPNRSRPGLRGRSSVGVRAWR